MRRTEVCAGRSEISAGRVPPRTSGASTSVDAKSNVVTRSAAKAARTVAPRQVEHRDLSAPLALDAPSSSATSKGFMHFMAPEDGAFLARVEVGDGRSLRRRTQWADGVVVQSRDGTRGVADARAARTAALGETDVKPVVAIVGRPNVGKSTLFNRLTRTRAAIVADFPGSRATATTARAASGQRDYLAIDTGGFEPVDGRRHRATRWRRRPSRRSRSATS